ncbi:MAG: hypothetical protein IPK78_10360 [Rhodospirillales bacterium]|nr:hypothetical protein [Rhodospirillales bacterium]
MNPPRLNSARRYRPLSFRSLSYASLCPYQMPASPRSYLTSHQRGNDMSWLANFRILPKLLALIAFLSVVAISIVLLAIDSLESLATSAREMRTSASEALTVARMNQNMLASNRAEYRMALDPEPDQVKGAQTRGEAEQRTLLNGWRNCDR